jgi:hypothetical protein
MGVVPVPRAFESYRVAHLQCLMPPHIDWLYSRLAEYVRQANGRWFGFDLDGFHDPLQATLYEAPVRGRYDWHIDRGTHIYNKSAAQADGRHAAVRFRFVQRRRFGNSRRSSAAIARPCDRLGAYLSFLRAPPNNAGRSRFTARHRRMDNRTQVSLAA